LRVFAGPNGSGKSTLAVNFPKKIPLGVFVNADNIEIQIKNKGFLDLSQYHVTSSTDSLRHYLHTSGFNSLSKTSQDYIKKVIIKNNSIVYNGDFNSYLASNIAGFIRNQLLMKGESFSFETVFSHHSKLDFLVKARKLGYRVYFYFLTTEDPSININRVKIRVAQNGHTVPEEKIVKRYYKSLELMLDAIKVSNRAYLFDNSSKYYELVAQVDNGKKVQLYTKKIPNWFSKYLFNKIQK